VPRSAWLLLAPLADIPAHLLSATNALQLQAIPNNIEQQRHQR
jgi:hypothetical protein